MSIDTAYFKRNGLIELLNYLSKNINTLKSIISSGGSGGADIPSIQTAIEDGTLTTINTKKLRIFAEQMMPTAANSMYFLQADLNPSQVASHTVNQFCYFRIPDVGGQIPASISGFKFKYAVSSTASVSGSNVIYAAQAAWVDADSTAEGYGTAVSVTTQVDEASTAKYVVSALSGEVKIGVEEQTSATRDTNKDLYIEIYRDATDAGGVDDYAASSKLTWVEIEFVIVEE